MTLDQITEKVMEQELRAFCTDMVLKFQFCHACFQRREASTNLSVSTA